MRFRRLAATVLPSGAGEGKAHMRCILGIVLAFALPAAAWAGQSRPFPFQERDSALGRILVDDKGMTLYTFDGDPRYRPTCFGDCAKTWNPFRASGDCGIGGYWTALARSDRIIQWVYGGRPLYSYSGDVRPGDINGEELRSGAWRAARLLCLPTDEFGQPDESEAITIIDAALEAGVEPLQKLREWCGVDLAELSRRSRIGVADLAAYENRRKEFGLPEVAAIANALGLPIYLLQE